MPATKNRKLVDLAFEPKWRRSAAETMIVHSLLANRVWQAYYDTRAREADFFYRVYTFLIFTCSPNLNRETKIRKTKKTYNKKITKKYIHVYIHIYIHTYWNAEGWNTGSNHHQHCFGDPRNNTFPPTIFVRRTKHDVFRLRNLREASHDFFVPFEGKNDLFDWIERDLNTDQSNIVELCLSES